LESTRLEKMVKGWFVGDFEPTAFATNACEVAVKRYSAGDSEAAHFHRIAIEVTGVVSGTVEMAGHVWTSGDIITLFPSEVTAFKALTDAMTVVVKVPGALHDKYPAP